MDDNDYWIPRNLDAPALFFMWEADSAMLFIGCLVLAGVMNMFLVGIVIAVIVNKAYGHLKEEGGRGLLMRMLYWYTPSELWLSKRLPSHVREYVGG